MLEHSDLTPGAKRLDAFFQVDLVKAHRRHAGLWHLKPDVRPKLPDGLDVRQIVRIVYEVP
ncbi:MAG: hypothetical protein OYM47_04025 [Gemmatimonadota bacterium]|nr:hypothetical protein [Gemmatimonadota bacterium]